MTYLANKALLYKDGFDLVKNYYYDFESEYNKLYEEIKQLIISDIYKAKIKKIMVLLLKVRTNMKVKKIKRKVNQKD